MHFKNLNLISLILVKYYGLYITNLLTRKGKYAILFTNGKRYQAEWILAGYPRIGAFEILKIINVNFFF